MMMTRNLSFLLIAEIVAFRYYDVGCSISEKDYTVIGTAFLIVPYYIEGANGDPIYVGIFVSGWSAL